MNLVSASVLHTYTFIIADDDGTVFVFERSIDKNGAIIEQHLETVGGSEVGGDIERFAALVDSL